MIPEFILNTNPAKKRLLEYLRYKSGEVNVNELITARPEGLGIIEYTGRISDLRKDGHQIVNTRTNYYQLIEGNTETGLLDLDDETEDYNLQLETLRCQYRKESDDLKKKILEVKANSIKKLIEEQQFEVIVRESLF